jgi:hypothetical protein
MLLLQKLQEYKDIKAVDRELKETNYRKLIKQLDFKLIVHLSLGLGACPEAI